MPPPSRQLRKITVPLTTLVEYLDRRTKELTNARIHHANYDETGKRLFIYVESEHDQPVPLEVPMKWSEVFGEVPCEVTGILAFVDDVTVSREGLKRLQDRIAELESRLAPPSAQ